MGRLDHAWRLLNLPCQGITRLASESLDRDLGRLERFVLRTHQFYCSPCRRYVRQLRLLGRLASRPEADELRPGPALPDEVRDRIKRALTEFEHPRD